MEKANVLLTEADERGLKWCTGESYKNITEWSIYKNNTCYKLTDGTLESLDFFKDENYTILTYEDVLLKGENDMKRINKNYDDGQLTVTYERDYIQIKKVVGCYIFFRMYIGEYNLTFEQANEMLKPFGIIIEPKATDWTKVEVGTKLKFTDGRVYGKITFKEWIEQTQQIIVFNGNKVEVYNEDEVELC